MVANVRMQRDLFPFTNAPTKLSRDITECHQIEDLASQFYLECIPIEYLHAYLHPK